MRIAIYRISSASLPLKPRTRHSRLSLSTLSLKRLPSSITINELIKTYLSALVSLSAEIENERLLYISCALKTKLSLGPLINFYKSSEKSDTFRPPRRETSPR